MANVVPSGGAHQAGFAALRPERSRSVDLPKDIEAMQEAFVRAHALERREPGGGKWPFAGDGPWHLGQPEVGDVAGDWSETLIETEAGKQLQVRKIESREPRAPLDAAEVAELALLRSWLQIVPEGERKLVWTATGRLAMGEGRVPWKAIGVWLGLGRTPAGVAFRYRHALALTVCTLNRWPSHRARRMAA